MTMHVFNTTVERRGQDVDVVVPLWSSEPGVVTASAAGCTFPDGETVTIAGTRRWDNIGAGGDYVSLPGTVANGRSDCTILVEVDVDRALAQNKCAAANTHPFVPLFGSIRTDTTRRVNWMLLLRGTADNCLLQYVQSASSSSTEVAYNGPSAARSGKVRFAVKLPDVAVSTTVTLYNGADSGTAARAATSGTMGGSEALVMWGGCVAAKIARQMDAGEMTAWITDGTVPATDREVYYPGNQEQTPGTIIYDAAGTNDLGPNGITGWQAARLTQQFVDTDPVVPASSIRVTIPAGVASPVTLTLTRPRAGVPARATDEERYETTTGTITIVDIPAVVHVGPPQIVSAHLNENPVAYCHITTDRPGTVAINCDRTIIDFPATVMVDASLEATIEGAILKGGDCEVTGSM